MKQLSALVVCLLLLVTASAQSVVLAEGTFSDVVYVPARDVVYALRPNGATDGNTLCRVDPVSGRVLDSFFIGSDPRVLAATTSGNYLYVGFGGESKARRFNLATQSVDLEFGLGGEDDWSGPFFVEEILPVRGSDDLVAISRRNGCCSPRHEGVALYDKGELLPEATADHTGSNTIAYTDRDGVLIGYNNETTDFQLRRMEITDQGLIVSNTYPMFDGFGVRIEYGDGSIYATNGQVAALSDGRPDLRGQVDLAALESYRAAAIEVVPAANRVYYLGGSGDDRLILLSVDQTTLTPVADYSIGVPRNGDYNTGAQTLIALGQADALAFVTTTGTLGFVTLCTSAVTEVPPAYTGPDYICSGAASLRLVVPAGARSDGRGVVWSDGQRGDTVYVSLPGEYSYRITDEGGCPGPASPTFIVGYDYYGTYAPGIATPLSTTLCAGGSILLSAETYSDNPIVWNTGDTTDQLTVTEGGTYAAYALSEESGCPSELSEAVTITISSESAPPAPVVVQGSAIDTCSNAALLLSVVRDAERYYWVAENHWFGQVEGSSVTVYPDFDNTFRYSVVAMGFDGCLSPATTGTVDFRPTPEMPYVQYNAVTNTLASSASGQHRWYYQGELEAETSSRFYTPQYNGFYTARVVGDGCASPESFLISVTAATTATADEEASRRISIFPNPTRDRLFVTFDPSLLGDLSPSGVHYQLYGTDGKQVSRGVVDPGLANAPISVAGLAGGVYILTFTSDQRAILRKRVTVL